MIDIIKSNEKLWDWFTGYKKEALISTAGIRGPQNILYPWDTRFPINELGIILATLAKANASHSRKKLAASEVRYNSKAYVETICRLQAAYGITTQISRHTIPVWMASFLIFLCDLDGAEYIIDWIVLIIIIQYVTNSGHSHSIVNKPFLSFIFNGLFSC